jgi:formamidopyrimidine-DNA glycosylase
MPELPEVETVRRGLAARLQGRRIKDVVLLKSGRETPRGQKFVRLLAGKKIEAVERRAKLIVWRLEGGNYLLIHLKMTGRLVFVPPGYKTKKHDAAIFIIGKSRLVWSDVRKFGYLRHVGRREFEKIISAYGPEPLETSARELASRLSSPKTRKVKAALLDQTKIAGIGNIYADESLFRARIRPTRRLGSLTVKDRLRLAQEIQKVLREAVRHGGSSVNDYVDATGKEGRFARRLAVYGRAGEKCPVCSTTIKRTVLAGRGTHYCPKCQR